MHISLKYFMIDNDIKIASQNCLDSINSYFSLCNINLHTYTAIEKTLIEIYEILKKNPKICEIDLHKTDINAK